MPEQKTLTLETVIENISAEEDFRKANCPEVFDDYGILAARMVDRLRISKEHNILSVGAGIIYSHLVACADREANVVDVVQPIFYNGIPQNHELKKYIKKARKALSKVHELKEWDINIYGSLVEEINLPQKYYSHVFLLNVLDDDTLPYFGKKRMIEAILSSIQDKSTILISACISQYEEKIDFLQAQFAREEDYSFRIGAKLSRIISASTYRAEQEIAILRSEAQKHGFKFRVRRKFPGEQTVYELKLES